ncbi:hypothetical protein [Jannaschia sp. W003]|uniref:hypothetical protein n=1 Tax=Jannaschia sp. W003 TaxID=2867012 RepID=UPI0021A34B93|nr:hypothetical protein [Jannaschia sp. W003]UWQ20654.1 hypothetical protein K3554_11770 [Jannaschia sp. W003]
MELILHLGAHRTATSSLQRLLDLNEAALAAAGVAAWTPRLTRSGVMAGLMGDPGRRDARRDLAAFRSAGRVSLRQEALAARGVRRLVISDENMLGGLRENRALAKLYPTAAARLERVTAALGAPARVHLAIRAPDAWWTSAFVHLMLRGHRPPDADTLAAAVRARRGWRQVVEDVAAAFPGAALSVWSYEDWGARPGETFEHVTGVAPARAGVPVVNGSPTAAALQQRLGEEGHAASLPALAGAYAPFTPDQRAELRARHADDLAWLADGADGLAEYRSRGALIPRASDRKGSPHGRRRHAEGESRMGPAGRR